LSVAQLSGLVSKTPLDIFLASLPLVPLLSTRG